MNAHPNQAAGERRRPYGPFATSARIAAITRSLYYPCAGSYLNYDTARDLFGSEFANRLLDLNAGVLERGGDPSNPAEYAPSSCALTCGNPQSPSVWGIDLPDHTTTEHWGQPPADLFGSPQGLDMGVCNHRGAFDGGDVPTDAPGAPMTTTTYASGTKGKYRGFPAIILEHTEISFVITYKRDGKWAIYSGARPEEFYATR